jgi:hypothetical protein
MFIAVSFGDASSGSTPGAVTYNGASASLVTNFTHYTDYLARITMWKLVNPSAGTFPVIVNAVLGNASDVGIHVATFGNVDQATPITGTGVSYNPGGATLVDPGTLTIASSAGNATFCIGAAGSAITTYNGTLVKLKNINGNTAGGNSVTLRDMGGTNYTYSASSGAADAWAFIGVDIRHD